MNVIWLKLICPVIVLCLVWIWNRERRKKRLIEEFREKEVPHYEYGILDEVIKDKLSVFPGIKPILDGLGMEGRMVRVYRVVLGEKTIATILFSWPSSLWRFREDRGEAETLGSYSHIHWVEVLGEYQKQGHFYKLVDMVILGTYKISSGITIDVSDPVQKEIFRKTFEFKDKGNYMLLDYDNWCRF